MKKINIDHRNFNERVEIPIREVSDEETIENIQIEKGVLFKEKIIIGGILILILFILFVFLNGGFHIEEERQSILKEEQKKLEIVKKELNKQIELVRKTQILKNQLEKCIELNSNTGSLVDCDLFFNK